MGIFIFFYFYLFLFYLLSLKIKDIHRKRYLQTLACGFGLWIILALRSPVCGWDLYKEGTGITSYYSVFREVLSNDLFSLLSYGPLYSGMEFGWIIYTKFVTTIFPNFQLYLAVTAFINIFLISKVIHRYSSHIILSFMVYFAFGIYLASFSTLRQVMALSITTFSFSYLINKEYIKFFFLLIIASSFHLSSIIFVLLLPMIRIDLSFSKGLLFLGVLIICMPILGSLISSLSQFLFGGARFNVESDGGGAYTLFVLYIIIYMMFLTVKSKSLYVNSLKIVLFLMVVGQSLGSISTGHLTRIAFFFSVFLIVAIPIIIDKYINNKYRRLTILITSFFLFLFFYISSKDGYLDVVPYHFFWEVSLPI